MAAHRLVTASDALKKFFKNVVAPWANQPSAPEVDMLRRKLVRNMAVWFAASPAPYRALHAFYVSCDDCAMVTFLMFLSVATKTGGLGTEDLARDVAEDMDHEIGLWMTRVRDAPANGNMEDDLRKLLVKSAARLMDDARRLNEEPMTDDDGKRALPEAEKDLQKGLALVACTAIRLSFLTGDIHNFRDCLRALRKFSAGPGTPPPSPDRATEEDVDSAQTWAQGFVENALAGVSKPIAEALARASGAEQLADDAEKMAVEAQKKAASAERRVAKAEKRVADLERRMGETGFVATVAKASAGADAIPEPESMMDGLRDRVAHLESMVANVDVGLRDRVAHLESMGANVDVGLRDRVAHLESGVANVDVELRDRVAHLESTVVGMRSGLARVQAEMGWLLPQFRLQFCHHYNGIMAMWQMQHDLHTPYVPPPEFMPMPKP